jgi:hypothetical protein
LKITAGPLATDLDHYVSEAQARTGIGFADQERLDQLRARHQEIVDELNTETEPAAPAPPAPGPADHADAASEALELD